MPNRSNIDNNPTQPGMPVPTLGPEPRTLDDLDFDDDEVTLEITLQVPRSTPLPEDLMVWVTDDDGVEELVTAEPRVKFEHGEVDGDELVRNAENYDVKAKEIPVGDHAWEASRPGSLVLWDERPLGRRLE